MENAAKAEGTKIDKFVTLPATAQDYSPQVAEATSGGADCLVMIVSETPYIAWMPAFAQSGSEAKMYGPQGNFNENAVKGFEEVVEGDVVAGMYPDISTPAVELNTGKRWTSTKPIPRRTTTVSAAWARGPLTKGSNRSSNRMSGEINNETFLKAAATAKIDLPGMVPPLNMAENWGKTGGPEGFERLVNRCVVFSEFKEGKLVPLSDEFEDVSEIAGGTKPHGLRAAVRQLASSRRPRASAPGAAGAYLELERRALVEEVIRFALLGLASGPPTRSRRRA